MPTYELRCPECGRHVDTFCPVAQRDEYVRCLCGGRMERLSAVKCALGKCEVEPTYYPAFGKRLTRGQLKNEIRRVNQEQGRDIVEVGNERAYMARQKPQKVKPDVKRAYEELRKLG